MAVVGRRWRLRWRWSVDDGGFDGDEGFERILFSFEGEDDDGGGRVMRNGQANEEWSEEIKGLKKQWWNWRWVAEKERISFL
ncbi:hypothetical protein L6452_04762 [Arctium lappa]|uniref:Uncharacterized protein n=1 Tax=Arctium lappa TaxID=4217 RepID=A0ACB9EF85_ARCLA|nr:hypothetical protein L6452_04762 [Arctium lappa]